MRRAIGAVVLAAATAAAEESPAPSRATARARAAMVNGLRAFGLSDERVLRAMEAIPRELFVLPGEEAHAYEDRPLPIGEGQTISAPHMVARMAELLRLRPADRVLEVGTGRGYAAAVMARLAVEVHTIEILEPLCRAARDALRRAGASNVTVHCGDGYRGLPERAPFDAISVAAAPDHVPPALVEQLARGGRLVAPVGPSGAWAVQKLVLIEKDAKGGLLQRELDEVRFVPMLRK